MSAKRGKYESRKKKSSFLSTWYQIYVDVLALVVIVIVCFAFRNFNNERIRRREIAEIQVQRTIEKAKETEKQEATKVIVEEKAKEEVNPKIEEKVEEKVIKNKYDIGYDDSYLLAKIAMSEAEGCSTKCKEYVILCVLNRVKDDYFPNTISEVVYQVNNGVYQFTPVGTSRWSLEPNDDCWEAVNNVKNIKEDEEDPSMGCTYFENCENPDNWHSRNLEFLFEFEGIRFYK